MLKITSLASVAAVSSLVLGGLALVGGTLAGGAAQAAEPVVAVAGADSYTQRAQPAVSSGTGTRWSIDGRASGRRRGYLKFTVPKPAAGTRIEGVTLSVYAGSDALSTGPGPDIYRTGNGWTESGLTWNNQPALGAKVASTGAGYTGPTWLSWDVSSALTEVERTGGGVVSLAVDTTEQRWLGFKSRESGTGPQLRLAVGASGGTPTAPTPPTPGSTSAEAAVRYGWGPVVAGDEFGYTGAPDPTRWSVYKSAGHAGNGLRVASAWSVADGVATVTGDQKGSTGGMSAKLDHRTYGRWETRMRTSVRDPQYHPVLILRPDVATSTCPEIDYAESTGDTSVVNFFMHYGCGGVQTYAKQKVDMTRWHNYAVSWTSTGMVGYLDGVEWFRDENPAHQPPGSMHATIQLDWFPDGTPLTTSWMQVDWTRVYAAS